MTYQIGDFGLTRVAQPWHFLITTGLFLAGDSSRYSHAFVIVGEDLAVEARPGGACYVKPSELWPDAVYSHIDLTDEQREKIAQGAISLIGAKYNYLDYLAIALLRFGFRPKKLAKFVADKSRQICSQLVDESWRRGGYQLFDDGRFPQDVTPGDLLYVGKVW